MSLYAVLKADPNSSPEELRRAYRKAALASHPDKHPDDPSAAERFREVQKAWHILSDERQRATYDARTRRHTGTSRPGTSRPGMSRPGPAAGPRYAKPERRTSSDEDDESDDDTWEYTTWDDLASAFGFDHVWNEESWEDLYSEEVEADAESESHRQHAMLRGIFGGLVTAFACLSGLWSFCADVPLLFPTPLRLSNRQFASEVSLTVEFRTFTVVLLTQHANSFPISGQLARAPTFWRPPQKPTMATDDQRRADVAAHHALAMGSRSTWGFRTHRPFLRLAYNSSDAYSIYAYLRRDNTVRAPPSDALLLASRRRVGDKVHNIYMLVQPAKRHDDGPATWPPPGGGGERELCVRLLKSGTIRHKPYYADLADALDAAPDTAHARWSGPRGRLRPFALLAVRDSECRRSAGLLAVGTCAGAALSAYISYSYS